MQTTKIYLMAALALMTVACSNDDNELTPAEQPAKAEGIPFTATISMGESASTRALAENGSGGLTATWATGEKVALIYTVGSTPTKTDAEVTKQADGTATISATLASGATNGSDVTIIYPATAADGTTGNVKAGLLAAQDGTLATIAANYDVRKGTGKLSINAGGATVNNGTAGTTVALTNQNAIFKFTLSGQSIDGSHPLVIKKGENDVVTTVTPASSMTSVYVAMPPAASSTYRFIVNSDDNKYIKSGTAAITAGKYYQTTLDLSTARYPLALSSATVDDLGSVIASDGNIYLKNAATPSGNTAVAMIAYKSEIAGKSLAIQLNASSESKSWNDAKTYVSGLTAVLGGTWRMPSKADWQNMFVGCAKSGDAGVSDIMNPIAGFKEKIAATGITWKSVYYWSSADSESSAWLAGVNLDGNYAFAEFYVGGTSGSYDVLGCLAF